MGSTKILVFKLREVIFTALFVVLGILLIIFLVFTFTDKKSKEAQATFSFVPGVYTASVMLEHKPINVEVTVDKTHINSVQIVDLDEATQTLFPLLEPAMENIESQLSSQTSLQPINVQPEYRFTSTLLLDAVNRALEKALTDVHK